MMQTTYWVCALLMAVMTSLSDAAPTSPSGDPYYDEYRHYCHERLGQPMPYQRECYAAKTKFFFITPGDSNHIFFYCCLGLMTGLVPPPPGTILALNLSFLLT